MSRCSWRSVADCDVTELIFHGEKGTYKVNVPICVAASYSLWGIFFSISFFLINMHIYRSIFVLIICSHFKFHRYIIGYNKFWTKLKATVNAEHHNYKRIADSSNTYSLILKKLSVNIRYLIINLCSYFLTSLKLNATVMSLNNKHILQSHFWGIINKLKTSQKLKECNTIETLQISELSNKINFVYLTWPLYR